MNTEFWLYVGFALLGSVVIGSILVYIVWFIITKLRNNSSIKNIDKEEYRKIVAITKPTNERRNEIDNDGIAKIRQFEKLRRTVKGTQPTDTFYAGEFKDERRISFQDGTDKFTEPISEPNADNKSDINRTVKFD